MAKICFVGNPLDTFIKNDCESLKNIFEINITDPPKTIAKWLKFIIILSKNVRKSDLTYCWFAGWHSAFAVFFSMLFGKKSIVIVGGWDAAYLPELNYGAFMSFKNRIPVKFVYKHVDRILVVAPFLKDDIVRNAKIKGENIECIPTGYNIDYWKPKGKKDEIVLTVALASDIQRVKLKGLDTFVRAAKHIKDVKFIVIGVRGEAKKYLESFAPKNNVELIESLPQNKILRYYQKAKVFCLLSFREGLPNVLCESMLCECIPIGTKINGVKAAIGDTGFYVDYGNEKETADIIKKALSQEDDVGKEARERIKKLFNNEKREEGLQRLVSKMVS